MTKYTINSPIHLTLEDKQGNRTEYTSENVSFHSHYGVYSELQATGMTRVYPVDTPENPTQDEKALCDAPLTPEQEAGLRTVAHRAKAIERRKLMNARNIEAAILEAQEALKGAEHMFNMSVLEALHTGLTQEAVEMSLFDGGFTQLENQVEAILLLDTDSLYTLDMTN